MKTQKRCQRIRKKNSPTPKIIEPNKLIRCISRFLSCKIGIHFRSIWKELVVTAISIVVLATAIIGFSELLNKSFTKIVGPVIALNERESNSNLSVHNNLQSFEIGDEIIEPEINMYGSEDNNVEILTCDFEGKDIVLSLNYGIPDNVSDYEGKVVISVDSEEVETYSDKVHASSEFNIDKV